MSPTPSVVDFVGGSRSSVAHADLGARRQMRRHARQLTDRVDAAEATSFCAWFCASSSSQSSSPRTSSSIWLSSPYCPPSHKRWRSSEQCSRESTCTALRLLQHNEKN